MRRVRLVFVRSFDVSRPSQRLFRVAVWRRVRGGDASAGQTELWSASEKALFVASIGGRP